MGKLSGKPVSHSTLSKELNSFDDDVIGWEILYLEITIT